MLRFLCTCARAQPHTSHGRYRRRSFFQFLADLAGAQRLRFFPRERQHAVDIGVMVGEFSMYPFSLQDFLMQGRCIIRRHPYKSGAFVTWDRGQVWQVRPVRVRSGTQVLLVMSFVEFSVSQQLLPLRASSFWETS